MPAVQPIIRQGVLSGNHLQLCIRRHSRQTSQSREQVDPDQRVRSSLGVEIPGMRSEKLPPPRAGIDHYKSLRVSFIFFEGPHRNPERRSLEARIVQTAREKIRHWPSFIVAGIYEQSGGFFWATRHRNDELVVRREKACALGSTVGSEHIIQHFHAILAAHPQGLDFCSRKRRDGHRQRFPVGRAVRGILECDRNPLGPIAPILQTQLVPGRRPLRHNNQEQTCRCEKDPFHSKGIGCREVKGKQTQPGLQASTNFLQLRSTLLICAHMNIGKIDLGIIGLYLFVIVGAGILAGLRQRRRGGANSFFLASRSLRWPTIGLALFATNISCVHLVSLAQAGYDKGLLMGNFEWMAAFSLLALSLFFVPFYIRSKVSTLPDFLEKRYSRECRDWLAAVSMVAAIVFCIAFPLSTGALVLHSVFGIDKWTCILLLCALTAVYTVFGGLAAVVITETIQAIVFHCRGNDYHRVRLRESGRVGGDASTPRSRERPAQTFHAAPLGSRTRFPLVRHPAGIPSAGHWYWCADQTIVQRVLGLATKITLAPGRCSAPS